MHITKLIGVLLIVLSCSAVGFLKSKSVCLRVKKLKLLHSGINSLFEYIEQDKYELKPAIENAFLKCNFITFENSNICCIDNDLTIEDKNLINDFLKSLGCSSKKSDCDRIKAFASLVQKNLTTAETERVQKSKIYQSFGVCIGLALGILLI